MISKSYNKMTSIYTTESDYSGIIVAIIVIVAIILFGIFMYVLIVGNLRPMEKLPITNTGESVPVKEHWFTKNYM